MEKIENEPMQNQHQQELKGIVSKELNGIINRSEELKGGFYGHVYKIDAETPEGSKQLVIKIVQAEQEAAVENEPNDNRVYGGRWSNLKPSHQLLTENNFKLPKLYSVGEYDSTHNYSLMEFIEGDSIKELMESDTTAKAEQLHGLVGKELGRMHAITRDFQGWVEMNKPYEKSWEIAFFESFKSHLDNASAKNDFIANSNPQIAEYIDKKRSSWTNPQQFVYSHTDGFQALAQLNNDQWEITGIIDCEDNQFTDQRFVLSGFELALEFSNNSPKSIFWENYEQHTQIDTNYSNLKGLFQLYYLLSWTPAFYDGWRGPDEEKHKVITRVEELIAKIFAK